MGLPHINQSINQFMSPVAMHPAHGEISYETQMLQIQINIQD